MLGHPIPQNICDAHFDALQLRHRLPLERQAVRCCYGSLLRDLRLRHFGFAVAGGRYGRSTRVEALAQTA